MILDHERTTLLSTRKEIFELKPQYHPVVPCAFECSVISHIGYRRPNNEDNFLLAKTVNRSFSNNISINMTLSMKRDQWQCMGVFDGMGGGSHGEIAALIAATEFTTFPDEQTMCKEDVDVFVRDCFRSANKNVIQYNDVTMLGSTGTVLLTDGTFLKVFHLGDSRAYLLRDNNLFQITKDQTLAEQKIEFGIYKADDPQVSIDKHKLTDYIGSDYSFINLAPLETDWIKVVKGDKLLLCSDGLYDMCSGADISSIMCSSFSSKSTAETLVAEALSHGGNDNITSLVLCAI